MARVKGGVFSSTLDVTKHLPLDARELVTKYEDLINPQVWQVNTLTTDSLYNGLRVSVNEEGEHFGVYVLLNRKLITNDNYQQYLAAKQAGKNIAEYFSMWSKILTENDAIVVRLTRAVESHEETLQELCGPAELPGSIDYRIHAATYGLSNEIVALKQIVDTGNQTVSEFVLEQIRRIPGMEGNIILDNKTLKTNKNGEVYVAEISTDELVQGKMTLVLNGNAD